MRPWDQWVICRKTGTEGTSRSIIFDVWLTSHSFGSCLVRARMLRERERECVCVHAHACKCCSGLGHFPMDYFRFFYKTILDYQVLVLMICQMCDFKNRFLTTLNRTSISASEWNYGSKALRENKYLGIIRGCQGSWNLTPQTRWLR